MPTVRLFVSSPSDVEFERQRVERVAERLNGELWPHVRFETIRWETKFYSAHKSFPEHIPEAADCDVVIAVFWSRLGTELSDKLPTRFRMSDGRPYPSGTAYEVMTAIEARKSADHPDVYVFRKTVAPTVALNDMAQRAEADRQWHRLEDFFANWFRAPDGTFLAAHHEFRSTDEFEQQVEKLLVGWLDERYLRGKAISWPIETRGSPFRGLAPFDAKHAPVFFGRMRKVMRAVDHLKDAARRSAEAPERAPAETAERQLKPFLLIVGPSGSGKSSLMRAGLAPRITAPGVVPEVDQWRTAVMRPGDGKSPFDALVQALGVTGKGDDPGGFGRALPEIFSGGTWSAEQLVELLASGDGASAEPVVAALDEIGEELRRSGGFERATRADLLLLVDQLEDIFAANITDRQRSSFARLLSALSATKRVWVVATLRGDLYNRLLKNRDFIALKDAGHTYDLAPPGPDELAEIVQRSAEASGLVYETDAASGERLDDRLLRDTEGKDILPLLQFTLDRLFEERSVVGDQTRLTFASYRAMGGLDGAINQSAERAVRHLGDDEIAALPRLLRSLAVAVREDSAATGNAELTIRAVPMNEAITDERTGRLVNALRDARIVLTSGASAEAPEEGVSPGGDAGGTGSGAEAAPADRSGLLRIAHQRVFECWERARKILHDHRNYFRARSVVEDNRRRWQSSGQRPDLLIPDGRPLEEAESLVVKYGEELSRDTRNFVALSGRRARRNRTLKRVTQVSLAVAAMLAIGAGIVATYLGNSAVRNEQRAIANYESARGTVDKLIVSINESLRNAGLTVATVDRALVTVRSLVDGLESASQGDPSLKRTRAAMAFEFSDTYKSAENGDGALKQASDSLSIRRDLAALRPAERDWQWDLALSLDQVGDLKRTSPGTADEARRNYQEAYAIRRKLNAEEPDNLLWKHGLSLSLVRVGDLKLKPFNDRDDVAGATADYEAALDLSIEVLKSDAANTRWERELSWDFNKVGDIHARRPDAPPAQLTAAVTSFEKSLCVRRYLVSRDDANTLWKRDVAFGLDRLAQVKRRTGDTQGANETMEAALDIRRTLSETDPGNMSWKLDLATNLDRIGELKLAMKDSELSVGFFRSAIDILDQILQRAPELSKATAQIRQSDAKSSKAIAALRESRGTEPISEADLQKKARAEEAGFAIQFRLQKSDPAICWNDLVAGLGPPAATRRPTLAGN
jgi:tetratricopeptide (TPR) repeat protein